MDDLDKKATADAIYQQQKSSGFISETTYQIYEKCLELNPNHVLALWELGRIYDGDHDHDGHGSYWDEFQCANTPKALQCFTRILELDPKFSQVYLRLANHTVNTNKEKALNYLLQYLSMNPEDYSVICRIGYVYYSLKNNQAATLNFKKCLEHNEKDQRALHGLADIYEDEGKFKEALQCLQKSLEIHEKNANTHAQIGRIYHKLGKINEAMNSYRRCNQLNSSHKQANHYLAKHLKH